MKANSHTYPDTAGRVKINGSFRSDDGLVEGIGKAGQDFIMGYEKSKKEIEEKTAIWVEKLRSLGVKAAHPDDGWHKREKHNFGLSYPYFDNGVKVGDMVALGDYEKFVVVVVIKKSGIFSTIYHYASTIHN